MHQSVLSLLDGHFILLESGFSDSHGYVQYNIRKSVLTLKPDGELIVANETPDFNLGTMRRFPTSMRVFAF